jgi:hypothetical protein
MDQMTTLLGHDFLQAAQDRGPNPPAGWQEP